MDPGNLAERSVGSYPPEADLGSIPGFATNSPLIRRGFFMFTVYILYSATFQKIYIGFTANLEQRFLSHNELGKKGWTIRFRHYSNFISW
jgi:hypothetical protein